MPSAPLSKIDFSNPSISWWGRRKFINSGKPGQDTSAEADQGLQAMDYVADVFKIAGQIAQIQRGLTMGTATAAASMEARNED